MQPPSHPPCHHQPRLRASSSCFSLFAKLPPVSSHAAEDVAAAVVTAATATTALSISSQSALAASIEDTSAVELAAAGVTSVVPAGYVPSPLEPGWEIWLGFVAGVVPFLIGSYEFGKRIVSGGWCCLPWLGAFPS